MNFKTNPIIDHFLGLTGGKPSQSSVLRPSDIKTPLPPRQSVPTKTEQVGSLPGRKAALLAAGADLLDLAIAMLETRNLDATPQKGYPYGDCKTGDGANFGIFRQNWWMIRTSGAFEVCVKDFDAFDGVYGPKDFDKGEKLNRDLALDVKVLHASMKKYGLGPPGFGWWWGHRGGKSRWDDRTSDPKVLGNANDVTNYRNAVLSIYTHLRTQPTTQTNITRVYAVVGGLGPTYPTHEPKPEKPVPTWCKNPPWTPPYLQGARR